MPTGSKLNHNFLWPSQTWLWPIVVLLVASGAFYFKPWQTKPTETISVSAEGKAQTAPDIAKITANIETQNPNLDTSRVENEKKVSTIVEMLKSLGVDQKDIKTQNLSAGPGYAEPAIQIYPVPRKPDTNTFSTSLEITVRNFDATDEILAALTQNGATNLYGPNLTLSDEAQETAKSEAREKAVDAARKKGEELAKLSGRKIGKAQNIKEQGEPIYPGPIFVQSEMDLKQRASQIQPGQTEVTINLAVDFALK